MSGSMGIAGSPVQSFVVKIDSGASGGSTGFGELRAFELV
jgi:hypothetical protein